MGNATIKAYWPPLGMVTIVLAGGRTEQYNNPVSAGDIMLRHPRHHLVRPDFFRSSPVNVLKPEEVLTPGHKFFLVPFHTVKKKLRRRESEGLLRSSSRSSTCRGSIQDCTKPSIAHGKKGATRIPSGRLTVLRKSSPSPASSTRQARKTLLPKEKLLSTSKRRPSIEERRRTTLKSHMRKKSADSEAAFEPPPDVAELDMFDSEDYMECISFESSVVLPKPAALLNLSVPECESFQSSAKSSMKVESLLTDVKEYETSIEAPGTSNLEGLIFKDFVPAKVFFNPNGGTRGLGENSVEKQPEHSSQGYVSLAKPPQPPSSGRASLADHILCQERVDSPKAPRPASDKYVSFDGKMQKVVDFHKAAGVPVLDKPAPLKDGMQKDVDSPKAPRPASDKSPVDGKMQKGVDSHKAARPVLDKGSTVNSRMQKELDSPSEPLLDLSGFASSDAGPGKRVHSSKPERPFLWGIATADYVSHSRLREYQQSEDLHRLSESTARPSTGPSAFYKWAPLSEQLNVKVAVHSQPAITNSGGPNAFGRQQPQLPSREKNLVSYLREPERPLTPTTRSEPPQQQQKEGSEEQVGYPLFYPAPGFAPGKAKIEVKSHNSGSVKPSAGPPQVDPKSVVTVEEQVGYPSFYPAPGFAQGKGKVEVKSHNSGSVKPSAGPPKVDPKSVVMVEEQVGYPLFYPAPGFAPGKAKIEVKSQNSGSVKPSAVPPQVDPKSVGMVKQDSVTTLVKKQTPALGNKLINHLCFAPQQGSQTPMQALAAAAIASAAATAATSGDTQVKQRREQPVKLIDHLKRDQNSPPNLQGILKQSAATSVNPKIQQYVIPIAKSGSTASGMEAKAQKELVAFQLNQAMKSATLRCNNAAEALTTSEGKLLKLPPTNLFRPRRIRTLSRRIYSAHWRPRLSPLVEFSPTRSELSVKS